METLPPKPANLPKVFAEICQGYTRAKWDGKSAFIKHLTHVDQIDVETFLEEEIEKAKKQGLPSREDKAAWLLKKGLWTPSDERELVQLRDYIKSLEKTRTNLAIPSQIRGHDKTINEERAKHSEMLNKRERLFGLTREKHAASKMQFYHIHLSFFKDRECVEPLFSMEAVNEWDMDESYDLLSSYVEVVNQFSIPNVKKIAVSDFFTNCFYLCGEQSQTFFGKPISQLTFYQINLLSYGLYFKSLLSSDGLPDDIRDNPDKIEDFVKTARNMKEMMGKSKMQGGNMGIVATAQDFKEMNLVDGTDAVLKQVDATKT